MRELRSPFELKGGSGSSRGGEETQAGGVSFSGRRLNRGGGFVRSKYFCSREHPGKLIMYPLLYFYHYCFLFLLELFGFRFYACLGITGVISE